MLKKISAYKQLLCEIHSNKYSYPEWASNVTTKDMVDIVCPIHGTFTQRLSYHRAGSGCPPCGKVTQAVHNKKPRSHFINICKKKHNNQYNYTLIPEGVRRHDDVDIICDVHGVFTQSLHHHINGHGCGKCANEKNATSQKKGLSYYITECNVVHENKYSYDLWTDSIMSVHDVDIICPHHGKFTQNLNHHMRGHGCLDCSSDIRKETMQATYGYSHPHHASISDDVLNKLKDYKWCYEQHVVLKNTLAAIANELGVSPSMVGLSFKSLGINVRIYKASMAERELVEFIESLGVVVQTSNRTIIAPKEIDIYIPEHKIAIEYNGLYWHSESQGKNKGYHLSKTQQCEDVGVRLVHIFEDEWRDQKQQCKDTIRHLLGKSEKGVYARKTTIKEISWEMAKQFLNKYHLLNAGQSGNFRIGAFDVDDNLIAVMVFGRQSNESSDIDSIELRRFVTNKKNNPGLGSKMFKWAINEKQYNKIIAFVDRRWFTGLVKSYIGFELVDITPPALWWTDGTTRYHRRFKTKQTLLAEYSGFDENMSKREMLSVLGYDRIWDSGKLKLEWTVDK